MDSGNCILKRQNRFKCFEFFFERSTDTLTHFEHIAHFQIGYGYTHYRSFIKLLDIFFLQGQHLGQFGKDFSFTRTTTSGSVSRTFFTFFIVPKKIWKNKCFIRLERNTQQVDLKKKQLIIKFKVNVDLIEYSFY